MKKTLVALAVTAFAASASATTVYEAEGTKVDLDGSLRLVLERAEKKVAKQDGSVKKTNAHTRLRNAGSRFGITAKHQLADDFYALGRLEFRFDKGENDNDGFGDVYTKRAYAGFGSQKLGQLTFGRQLTIADDLSQSKDYEYGINPKGDYIPTSGNQVVRYDYNGVENLQLSANYNFAQERDATGEVLPEAVQNAYGVGALYNVDNWDLRAAYGHTNYKTAAGSEKHRKDAVLGSLGYTVDALKLSFDAGYAHENNEGAKTNKFYVSPNFAYQVTPASSVYGNYLYERAKTKDVGKEKTHGFLLGVDYKFHKQVVAFVEGKYARTKEFNKTATGYAYSEKTTDKAIGVGMRVYW
ncbi:porin [Mannheimia sp. AT1]|uniref:Porin n=1 Tax=Mannheimia cairinae TaxID=3025936 RepID=A0ABT5MSZ6_9PAST|nr:porin [Mannheimia cairinae]MDD0824726.1 porin [Mannheimia cairinae]MDD0826345.1 porin [Mannheimia cairinae]